MKTLTTLSFVVLILSSCTSYRTFDETSKNYDDTYYSPSDEKALVAVPVRESEIAPYVPESRVPQSQSYSPQDNQLSTTQNNTAPSQNYDDRTDYEDRFNRFNGNRGYNSGYDDGYDDALNDNYYSGNYNTGYNTNYYSNNYFYRNPNRGFRNYYRYPRNTIYVGYSNWGGWNYGFNSGWGGYGGWNCYGPSWYGNPYANSWGNPYGYGYGYNSWGNGWNSPYYGGYRNNSGWGGQRYGGYYNGGYSSGGNSGGNGGTVIRTSQGTVNAPRTTVGTNAPTTGRADQNGPRGRTVKMEGSPDNDGLDPRNGGISESVGKSGNGNQPGRSLNGSEGADGGRQGTPEQRQSGRTSSSETTTGQNGRDVNQPQPGQRQVPDIDATPQRGQGSNGNAQRPTNGNTPREINPREGSGADQGREITPNGDQNSTPNREVSPQRNTAQPEREQRQERQNTPEPRQERQYTPPAREERQPQRQSTPEPRQERQYTPPARESQPQRSTPTPSRSEPSRSSNPSGGSHSPSAPSSNSNPNRGRGPR